MGPWLIAISFTGTLAGVVIATYGIKQLWHAYNDALEDIDDLQLENTLLWERNRTLNERLK